MTKVEEVSYDFYHWNKPNGPKERIDSYAQDTADFLFNTADFGVYCHGNGDLLADFLSAKPLELSQDDYDRMRHWSDEIVDRLETAVCGVCNQDNEGDR